ncbi:MAG: hypothetical protein WB562_19255 [Candidatus Sulfotelmatobacter sp.]
MKCQPRLGLALVMVACGIIPLGAQNKLQLTERDVIPISGQRSSPTLDPIKCDTAGNIFVRFAQVQLLAAPIITITPSGERAASFSIGSDLENRGGTISDFSPAEDGGMYALSTSSAGFKILHFSKDGRVASATQLDLQRAIDLKQFVALPDGKFFLRGTTAPTAGKREGDPFNMIVDDQGELLREVTFPEDSTPRLKNKKNKQGDAAEESNAPVAFGKASLGDDGNIYIMRSSSPVLFFVVSPAGELIRKLKVSSPIRNGGAQMFEVRKGRLAIEFLRLATGDGPPEEVYRVVNTGNGQPLFDYVPVRGRGGWACYDGDEFTFLGAENRQEVIVREAP